jgi:hypothetical protein
MTAPDLLTGLPGEDLIRRGLADFAEGRQSIPACLVAIGNLRLRRAGLISDKTRADTADAELRLYRLLREAHGDTYSNYNALIRQLVSFEQALDRRCRKGRE